MDCTAKSKSNKQTNKQNITLICPPDGLAKAMTTVCRQDWRAAVHSTALPEEQTVECRARWAHGGPRREASQGASHGLLWFQPDGWPGLGLQPPGLPFPPAPTQHLLSSRTRLLRVGLEGAFPRCLHRNDLCLLERPALNKMQHDYV